MFAYFEVEDTDDFSRTLSSVYRLLSHGVDRLNYDLWFHYNLILAQCHKRHLTLHQDDPAGQIISVVPVGEHSVRDKKFYDYINLKNFSSTSGIYIGWHIYSDTVRQMLAKSGTFPLDKIIEFVAHASGARLEMMMNGFPPGAEITDPCNPTELAIIDFLHYICQTRGASEFAETLTKLSRDKELPNHPG